MWGFLLKVSLYEDIGKYILFYMKRSETKEVTETNFWQKSIIENSSNDFEVMVVKKKLIPILRKT